MRDAIIQMLENRTVRYIIYGVTVVVVSEMSYHSYQFVRKLIKSRTAAKTLTAMPNEVAEVIWTSELTQSCSLAHRQQTAAKTTSRHEQQQQQQPSQSPQQSNVICYGVAGGGGVGASGATSGRFTGFIPPPAMTKEALCSNRYCAGNNIGRLISWIDQTKHTIDLAMYTFTSYELSLAIERARTRGVLVRIISDKEMVYSSGSQICTLTKAGVPVRSPISPMLMHHKFCILDGPQRIRAIAAKCENASKFDMDNVRGILMSGSLNWTMQGFGGNWENIVITSNAQLVHEFELEFERMWKAFDHKFTASQTQTARH